MPVRVSWSLGNTVDGGSVNFNDGDLDDGDTSH